jgi:hypothetical protein
VVRLRLLRPALWAGPSGDRVNAPATNISDLGIDMIAEQGMALRNTMLLLYSPKCSMALAGPPRSHENELLPWLFSHQCFMALAGPPRSDENKEEVVALVRRRFCLVPQSPYTSVTLRSLEGTPNCCLRARILDSVLSGSSKRRPYFHTSAWKVGVLKNSHNPVQHLVAPHKDALERGSNENQRRVIHGLLTSLDPNLTLTRTQHPAIVGNTGNTKPFAYAGFANYCNT